MQKYLLYKIHHGALSNQRMSVELAVGIAKAFGRTLVLFGDGKKRRITPIPVPAPIREGGPMVSELSQRRASGKQPAPTIFDILEPLPIDHINYSEFVSRYEGGMPQSAVYNHELVGSVVNFGEAIRNGIEDFRESRRELTNPAVEILQIDRATLGFYSRVFYNTGPQFVSLMRSIQAKKKYRDLGRKIAKSLGKFNAVHIRLTDFREHHLGGFWHPQEDEDYRQRIVEVLEAHFSPEDPLVISTDEPNNEVVLDYIQSVYTRSIIIDHYILENFSAEFEALDFAGDIVMALLCQEALSFADDFVGTFRSTFTSYIQRGMLWQDVDKGRLGDRERFKFTHPGFDPKTVDFRNGVFPEKYDGPYSWNRIELPINAAYKTWIREWEEAVKT